MDVKRLGAQIKTAHPDYADMTDEAVGQAFAKKYGISVDANTTPSATPAQKPQTAPVQQAPAMSQTPAQPQKSLIDQGVDLFLPKAKEFAGNVSDSFSGKTRNELIELYKKDPEAAKKRQQEIVQNIMKNKDQAGLELTSMVAPVGQGVKGMIGMSALSGGLRGASEVETTADLPKILGGVVGGAATAGILGGAGKILGETGKALVGKVAEEGSQRLGKASPAVWRKIAEEKGIDLNNLISKYTPANSTLDDLLGKVGKNNEGHLGQTLKTAEDQIQTVVKNAGNNVRISGDEFVSALQKERKALGNTIGNEDRKTALDSLVNETKALFKNGRTVKQLLDMKRAADSKFGRSVVEEEKGSVATSAQKMLGNVARAKLKQMFPEIADALETQSEVLTLSPVLEHARAINNTQGSQIRIGDMGGIDLMKPGTWIAPVVGMDRVASTMTKATPVGGLPPIVPSVGLKTATQLGGIAGSAVLGGTPDSNSQVQNQAPYEQGNINSSNSNQELNHNGSLPSIASDSITTQPESQAPSTATGYTVDQLEKAYGDATLVNDKPAMTQLKALLDLETKHQTRNKPSQQQEVHNQLESTIDQMANLYSVGTKDSLSQGNSTVGLGGLISKGKREVQKQTDQGYVDRMQAYNNMRSLAAGIINKARQAGTLNSGEYEIMIQNMPNEYTSEAVAKEWFSNAKKLLSNMPVLPNQEAQNQYELPPIQ